MADTLAAYLSIRAGNKPDAMIINGEPRIVYRDYKDRGVLIVVGPDTYDVVLAKTEADIEKLYAVGCYRRWRYDGKDVHEVEVERPVSDPAPGTDPLATRVAAALRLPASHQSLVAQDLAALIADLWAEVERRRDETTHLRQVVDILTGNALMPPLSLGDNDAKDPIVKLRSARVGMVVRELGRSCAEHGGENNLSVMFQPESGEHEWADWRYEVHVTKPGGKSPTEQRDEARAEAARLHTALAEALALMGEQSHSIGGRLRAAWVPVQTARRWRLALGETRTTTPKED